MKIIIFLIFFILNACNSNQVNSVKIYYSSENFTTVTPVRCGDLTYIAKDWVDSLTISSSSFLAELESEISKLEPPNDSLRQLIPLLDTRVEVVINDKTSTGKLLCLSKFGDIVFDDFTMKESRTLIDLVFSKIEENDKDFSD